MDTHKNMISIPVDVIVEILKNLDESVKDEIFERVFLEEDTFPVDEAESSAIQRAEAELEKGETVNWPFGQ